MKKIFAALVVVTLASFAIPSFASVVTESSDLPVPENCGAYGAVCGTGECVPDETNCTQCHAPDPMVEAMAAQQVVPAAEDNITLTSSDGKFTVRVPDGPVPAGQSFSQFVSIDGYVMRMQYAYFDETTGTTEVFDSWPWFDEGPKYPFQHMYTTPGTYSFDVYIVYCGDERPICFSTWVYSTMQWEVVVEESVSVRNPVLFIPGLLASNLYHHLDNGEWDPVWLNPTDLLSIGDDFLDPLERVPDEVNPDNYHDAYNLVANGRDAARTIYNFGDVGDWTAFIFTNGYCASLYDILSWYGYTPTTGSQIGDFTFLDYDWRLAPSEDIRTAIGEKIDQLLLANPGASKVDIVAHSTGGLLIKDYLQRNDDSNIGKVVLVGVPNLGAPKAFLALQFGDMEFSLLGDLFTSKNELMKISQNWPSSYTLSPSTGFYVQEGYQEIFRERNIDMDGDGFMNKWDHSKVQSYYHGGSFFYDWWDYPAEDLTDYRKHNGTLADEAVEFHERLDPLENWAERADQVFLVTGQGMSTTGEITLSKGAKTPFSWRISKKGVDGDSTVPVWSASIPSDIYTNNINRYFVYRVKHSEMLDDSDVSHLIGRILTNVSNPEANSNGRISTTPFDPGLDEWEYIILCPVDVHVYDLAGRHIGPMENGLIAREIKEILYERQEAADGYETRIHLPADSDYIIELVAVGEGAMRITARRVLGDAITETRIYDEIGLTAVTTGQLQANGTAGPGDILLDRDGDGLDESTETADAILGFDERDDETPPVTEVYLSGETGQNGIYISEFSSTGKARPSLHSLYSPRFFGLLTTVWWRSSRQ